MEIEGSSKKSKILIVGATGNLGYELAKASLQASHPTFALVRDYSLADPSKALKLQSLVSAGLSVLKGSLADEDGLYEIIKLVDVVISAVSSSQILDQKPLVRAIKRAGCIKRFIPSEFGADPDRCRVGDLDHGFYSRKSEFRRLVEAEGIPYTYICCNFFMTYLLPSLVQPGAKVPPREKVSIFGDGTAKGVFVKQSDVAAFTIRTVDDRFTLNKTLYLRPTGNMYSMIELIDIWEEKVRTKLQKSYITEEELLKLIKGTLYPECMELVFIYSAMVKGDHTYYDIESSTDGVEAGAWEFITKPVITKDETASLKVIISTMVCFGLRYNQPLKERTRVWMRVVAKIVGYEPNFLLLVMVQKQTNYHSLLLKFYFSCIASTS